MVFSIVIVLMMIASTVLIATPIKPVQAALAPIQPYAGPLKSGDVADGTFDTNVWISIRPNVVGKGQTLLVNVWLHLHPMHNDN